MKESGYDFYLKKCLLPVAPEKLEIKINNANETITLIDSGQVNILKAPELSDIEFECMIPQVEYLFATYKSGFRGASYFLGHLEKLKTDKKPFQFIVSRTMPDGKILFSTNIKVSMEDYKITEKAEEGFDLMVKINLKQYRGYGTKTVKLKKNKSGTTATLKKARAAETSPAPTSDRKYKVVKGDCLWSIAKKFYDDGSKYQIIYRANKEIIGGNPNLIYPGQVLTIPAA